MPTISGPAMPADFIIAPSVDVNLFACVSVRPNWSPAVFAQASICRAPSPKVTSTTFCTSSRSLAAWIASFPKSRRALPAFMAMAATPIFLNISVNLLPTFSVVFPASLSHLLPAFLRASVMSFMAAVAFRPSALISNTICPSAATLFTTFLLCHTQQALRHAAQAVV